MKFAALGSAAVTVLMLTACGSGRQSSPAGTAIVPSPSQAGLTAPKRRALGCYGTFGVEATPCPVRLTEKDGGKVTVSITGPGVALAVVLASDCAGSGSVCSVAQIGYTQFEISSTRGENKCGKAYVVFEGLTASESPVGTATVKVINTYC